MQKTELLFLYPISLLNTHRQKYQFLNEKQWQQNPWQLEDVEGNEWSLYKHHEDKGTYKWKHY